MIKRYEIQCVMCGDTDVAHEIEDGNMVMVEDLKPFIESLQNIYFWDSPIIHKHNDATKELRRLIRASAG